MRLYALAIFLFLGFQPFFAQNIKTKCLKKHVKYLAHDKRQGRGTGTKGELDAAKYIAKHFKKIGLQPKGTDGYFHRYSFKKPTDPHGGTSADAPTVTAQNVVGYLDNGAQHTIVIGAHYDHLGLGHDHNSLDPEPYGKIHNGADDNASGTAGVIELARHFAKNKEREEHNYLFICFSGEELGLFGSKNYVENPTIDLKAVSYMINMDMIGRFDPKRGVVVGGVGTAPDFVPFLNNRPPSFPVKQDSSGIGPSDHTSFYLKDIPSLFFFTGQHEDYHKPSDDVDKVNFSGMKMVLDYIVSMMDGLDEKPQLTFQKTAAKKSDTPDFKVTLGIMPDYTFQGTGVHVDAVREGRTGANGGLLKHDIIVQMGDFPIKDVMEYMHALAKFEKGDKTTLVVERGEEHEKVTLDIEF